MIGVAPLIDGIDFDALLGDKAFDANWIVDELDQRGAKVVISQRPKRLSPLTIEEKIYKWRHLIEKFFCKVKKFKRIAMRVCKPTRALRPSSTSQPQSSIQNESPQTLGRFEKFTKDQSDFVRASLRLGGAGSVSFGKCFGSRRSPVVSDRQGRWEPRRRQSNEGASHIWRAEYRFRHDCVTSNSGCFPGVAPRVFGSTGRCSHRAGSARRPERPQTRVTETPQGVRKRFYS